MVLYCCIPYLDCGSSLRPTIFSYTSYTLILFKTFRYGTVLQNARIFFQIVFLDFLILPVFFTLYFNYLTILIWYLVAKFSFLLNMSVSARRFILQACQKPGTYVHRVNIIKSPRSPIKSVRLPQKSMKRYFVRNSFSETDFSSYVRMYVGIIEFSSCRIGTQMRTYSQNTGGNFLF